MFRRFCCSILIGLLIAVPFSGQLTLNVYAATDIDIDWPGDPIEHDELTQAFLAYCKARDITIDSSILGAATEFTSSAFANAAYLAGVDLYQLQAEINKVVDPTSNGIKYFVFTSLGITGFNRICAQLLTDFDLEVGDQDVDKVVKSGRWFESDEGYGCWVYVLKDNVNAIGQTSASSRGNLYLSIGTPFMFNNEALQNLYSTYENIGYTPKYYVNSNEFYFNCPKRSETSGYRYMTSVPSYRTILSWSGGASGSYRSSSNIGVFYKSGNLYLGMDRDIFYDGAYEYGSILQINGAESEDTDVTVKSPDIKPDLPEDPTNIAPDGNYTPSDQDPTEPPPDPTGGTQPDWSMDTDVEPDGDDGWKIPFSLPDLDIDWSIEGLSKKFPFSIPFDVYHLCSVLNAAPQAPHFTGQLDLKVYVWDIDIDLSEFDNMAAILRTMELIGFVIGLAMITRQIIKG